MPASLPLLLILTLSIAKAASCLNNPDGCIVDPDHPPCNGAVGHCTQNADGSLGGFVAKTAYVQTQSPFWGQFCGMSRNIPYLSPTAEVCDSARISGSARILDYAKIYGSIQISSNLIIDGNDEIYSMDSESITLIRHQKRVKIFKNNHLTSKIYSILEEYFKMPEDDLCPICLEDLSSLVKTHGLISTHCKHTFCKSCFEKTLKYSKKCPLCRQDNFQNERIEVYSIH